MVDTIKNQRNQLSLWDAEFPRTNPISVIVTPSSQVEILAVSPPDRLGSDQMDS